MINVARAPRAHGIPRGRQGALRIVVPRALAVAFALLWCPMAWSVQQAFISPGFPLVNDTTGNYAVRVSYVAQAAADNQTDNNHDSETFYPFRDEVVGAPNVQTFASAPATIWTTSASVNQDAHGGAGTIGGHVGISVTDGPASASTDIILDFIDKIHMIHDCDLVVDPHITGSAQRSPYTGIDFAQTNAEFDTYFFSAVNPPPSAGTAFVPAYYARVEVDSTGQTLFEAHNSTDFPAGTDWWFVVRLELRAGANIPYSTHSVTYPGDMLTAVGDFEHTAFTTLDDPNNGADPVYSSASGIDYTTAALVPEPGTLTMMAGALAALCLRRRGRVLTSHRGIWSAPASV